MPFDPCTAYPQLPFPTPQQHHRQLLHQREVLLARPAQPVEMVAPFVMLASEEASYITGAYVLATDGKPAI